MQRDPELEAAAALVAAAFDGADKPTRRQLWRLLRAAVSEVRGSSWRPPQPWAGLLAQLRQGVPRRKTTRLGIGPGGVVNTKGDTRPETAPWSWASTEEDSAA